MSCTHIFGVASVSKSCSFDVAIQGNINETSRDTIASTSPNLHETSRNYFLTRVSKSDTMVVLELLRWRAPASLILAIVLLCQNPKLALKPGQPHNDFVEVFSGDAAVSLACWQQGMVGSAHDVRYTKLMDLTTTHGFSFLCLKKDIVNLPL